MAIVVGELHQNFIQVAKSQRGDSKLSSDRKLDNIQIRIIASLSLSKKSKNRGRKIMEINLNVQCP